MKVEYLENTSSDYPEESIIRIYDFEKHESILFSDRLSEFIRRGNPLNLNDIDFISMLNCSVEFEIGESDFGLIKMDSSYFKCVLTKSEFTKMLELIKAFNDMDSEFNGYHWLYDNLNPIDLLYSPDGKW